jgi:exonuclease III
LNEEQSKKQKRNHFEHRTDLLRIITLNVRGFKTSEKMNQLEYSIDLQQNDIAILTETKSPKSLVKKIHDNKLLKLFTSWDPGLPEGSGVTIALPHHLTNCIANIWRLDGYALAVLIKSIDNFLIIGLYNSNKDDKILNSIERKFFSFITPLAHKAKEKKWKVIIGGDFNSTY